MNCAIIPFPRSSDRGLIEADPPARRPKERPNFRDHRIAASLMTAECPWRKPRGRSRSRAEDRQQLLRAGAEAVGDSQSCYRIAALPRTGERAVRDFVWLRRIQAYAQTHQRLVAGQELGHGAAQILLGSGHTGVYNGH